jgi:hypothetical protein
LLSPAIIEHPPASTRITLAARTVIHERFIYPSTSDPSPTLLRAGLGTEGYVAHRRWSRPRLPLGDRRVEHLEVRAIHGQFDA